MKLRHEKFDCPHTIVPLKLDHSNDKIQSGKRELKKPLKHYFACNTLEKKWTKGNIRFCIRYIGKYQANLKKNKLCTLRIFQNILCLKASKKKSCFCAVV